VPKAGCPLTASAWVSTRSLASIILTVVAIDDDVALRLARNREDVDPVAWLTAADAAAEACDRVSGLTRTPPAARPCTHQDADDPARLADGELGQ